MNRGEGKKHKDNKKPQKSSCYRHVSGTLTAELFRLLKDKIIKTKSYVTDEFVGVREVKFIGIKTPCRDEVSTIRDENGIK